MSGLVGTRRLVRLALRRDRVQLPVWLAALTALHIITAVSVIDLYPDESERVALARSSATSAVTLAFNGLVSGTGMGAIVASQSLLIMSLGAAFMSIFMVVRHTRQNEETGRAELIGAASVGRHAPLATGVVVVVLANIALGALNAVGLMACSLPASGSIAIGAAIAGVGIAFGAVTAIAAQIPRTSRAANGLAAAALGVAFGLRTIGDMASHVTDGGVKVVSGWPSWLSPIGWGQQIRPYDDNRWWVLALLAVFAIICVSIAFSLAARRDLGAGMIADRPGPPSARAWLPTPLGLAWRLHRGVLLGWAVGLTVLGFGYGAVADQVDDLIGDSGATADIVQEMTGGTGSMTDLYLALVMGIMGLTVTGYAIAAAMRMRHEESAGTLEAVLATAVGRARWLAGHVLIVCGGVLVLLMLSGGATGLAYGLSVDDALHQTARFTAVGLVQAPAVLVLVGVAVAAFGVVPRRARAVAWGVFALCLVLGQFGELFGLPEAVMELSPFTHLPAAPTEAVTVAPLAVLCVVAVVIGMGGLAAFRRRDLVS